MTKPVFLLAALPLLIAGCTTTNPKAALDDVNKIIEARLGQQTSAMGNETVNALLQTNLTAQSAVAIALLNNKSLQAEFQEIGISQAELAQAARLNNIKLMGSWRFPDRPPSIVDTEYSVAGDFLNLLMLPARKKIAARNLEQTKLRVADEVLKLAAETQEAFYTVQGRAQFGQRIALIVEVNDAAADFAQRQYDAGNINSLELHNQQAATAQARFDLAQTKAQLSVGRERLNRLLGLSGAQTKWTMVEELPPLPEKELPVENVEALAVQQRLDLQAMKTQMESIAGALQLKKKFRFVPGVTVGASAERSPDGQRVTGPSLELELPIFDQGQPALAKLAAEYRQAQNNFQALETNVRSEARQARDVLVATRASAEYHVKVLLPQRQQILHETLLHYNAMQKSGYELFAAKEREQMTERETIEAIRDYWIARGELERAVGGRLSNELPATTAPTLPAPKKEMNEHHHHENK
ncbi:MAG: TolC family protein [Verrucomicrobiota bacterium]